MRDILTALAGAVILILLAALAVPPFIGWEGRRDLVDRAIGRSLSLKARTEGRIEVRLLPSPRLRIDRLHLDDEPGKPSLDAHFIKAELALAPLLKGEFRFTQTRIGRAEVRLPVSESEAVPVPPGVEAALRQRDLAIEDLEIQQFLLTTLVPATGRTDQFQASALRVQAPALVGPWRVEGTSGGVPFRLATGEPGADGSLLVKVSGGGDAHPRFEADARLALVPVKAQAGASGGDMRMPEAEGSARLVVGPPTQAAGAYLPFSLGGKFKAKGTLARFESVNAEIDPGGQAIRLAGTGQIDLRAWRAGLNLEARRVDLDAFLLSGAGQALLGRGLPRGRLPVMLDLDLAVESVALGLDEWSNLKASGTFDRSGGLLLRRLGATAPGAAALSMSGDVDTEPAPRFNGSLSIEAAASDGFGRYLRKLGAEGPVLALMDGRPLQASAEISAAPESYSLRTLRFALGEARVTGSARYAPGEAGGRPRFDAQLAARAIDIATLPSFGTALASLEGRDIGLTVEARDVRYGPAGVRSGNGSITARVQSDGPALAVDSLEVANLAGANASLSGRIAPDGSGRITGRLTAPAAAPLAALLDRVWVAESRLVPGFLRAGALDLAVTVERQGETLRTSAKGTAAGGPLDAALTTKAGRVETADIALSTPRAGLWFGREDMAGLDRPAELRLRGARATDPGKTSPLALQVSGTLAGTALATKVPILLGAEDEPPLGGEITLSGADIGPFLRLAGAAALPPGTWPAALTAVLSRDGGAARADIAGTVAGAAVEARLARGGDGGIGGSASVERLSLPQLATALVVPAGARAADGKGGWSPARFGPAPKPGPRLDLDLRVATLDLGRGLVATGSAFRLGLDDGAMSLSNFAGKFAEGRLAGSVSIARQGSGATLSGDVAVSDASIPALADGSPIAGRLGASVRFGASGDSPAALVGNLAGSGEIALSHLTLPGADPGGIERALTRALADDDPLREGRLQALTNEEFAKAGAGAEAAAKAPATLVGGVLRAGPLDLDLAPARWTGSVGYDFRDGRLDARGTLTAGAAPKGWSGGPPAVQLGFSGPLSAPERSLDTTPLVSGLAALVLQRELEKIELLEIDQAERQRRRARIEMDRARAAALKAAADRAAAEEAARQAKLKAQQAAEETARRARETSPAPTPEAEGAAPLDIRPPAAQP